jgi:hypothetical protein
MFDHLNVLDGMGCVIGFCVVTTLFDSVVTTRGFLSVSIVETPGGSSSEDEGVEIIGPMDDADVNC